jgi:predicted GNAT superfamily acetyltransferase
MISYTTVQSNRDLQGILELQQQNLAVNLSAAEILQQGFVTVHHSPEDLQRMHDVEPSIIAKENEQVIAYVLAMTSAARDHIEILRPMFEIFEDVIFKDQLLLQQNFIMIGQVCVAKAHRGKGVFEKCYDAYKEYFQHRYDFAVTEIAERNVRSMKAHSRIGFTTIHTYSSPDGEKWNIVAWDWTH